MQTAYASDRWLARIMTLPDRVWREPELRRPLTFLGGTREEVEAAAFAHMLRECDLRGERILGLNYASCIGLDTFPARRIIAMLPVIFQVRIGGPISGASPAERSFTANLSESGLFLVTARDIGRGSLLSMSVGLPGVREKIEGQVAWSRRTGEEGRPPGAGIQLIDPPISDRAVVQGYR
jgi:hypothetical protein